MIHIELYLRRAATSLCFAHTLKAKQQAAQRQMSQPDVWYLNPLLSTADSAAVNVPSRNSDLVKTGRQLKTAVVNAGRVFASGIGAERVDIQASLERAYR